MNPNKISLNSERKSYQYLDARPTSNVLINIKNDDDVIIKLYRNNKKSQNNQPKSSFGRRSQIAECEEESYEDKSAMLKHLYRNTFGPTLDETILVGMETYQLCQRDNSLNDQTLQATDTPNCIQNELSWDCSTLLPANANLKQYESICTSTSNCMLDKETNLSSIVTNQCEYCPATNRSQKPMPYGQRTLSAETIKSFSEQNKMLDHVNNISSDENLTSGPNFGRRSGDETFRRTLNRESFNIPVAPQEARRTSFNRPTRKSFSPDPPSPPPPRKSRRSTSREPSFSRKSFQEEQVGLTKMGENTCGCTADISEMLNENSRKLSRGPSPPPRTSERRRDSTADNPRRSSARQSAPRVSYRERAVSAQSFEEYQGRNSTSIADQQRASVTSTGERTRKSSAEISDFFRKNSRQNTLRDSTAKSKTSQIEGYIRRSSSDESLCVSPISPETPIIDNQNDPRRKSFNEETSRPSLQENLRRSIDNRESIVSSESPIRRSTLKASLPRNSFNKRRSSSIEDNPVLSTFSPEISEHTDCMEETVNNIVPAENSRKSTDGRESKVSARSFIRGSSIIEEKPVVSTFSPEISGNTDCREQKINKTSISHPRKSNEYSNTASDDLECRCKTLQSSGCGCEKGKINRNKIPQETRYAITRVTNYDDYTTYEILKSTRAKPRKIPEVLEKIFIEKKQ